MYGSIPKDTLAEVLLFLSENEDFDSLKKFGTISPKQLQNALQALAKQLKQDAKEETSDEEMDRLLQDLKKPFQEIVAKLSLPERKKLLKGFLN